MKNEMDLDHDMDFEDNQNIERDPVDEDFDEPDDLEIQEQRDFAQDDMDDHYSDDRDGWEFPEFDE